MSARRRIGRHGTGSGTGRESDGGLPPTLPDSLRALERALADVQYAATMADPLGRADASQYVERLDRIREQTSDLARFVEQQLG